MARTATRGAARAAAPPYVLVHRPVAPARAPVLDEAQRAVAEHAGGPLVVLAGPGTGKTTTLVESVAARVARGADPARLLVLTFSRKAAGELRDRITARLGRTTATPPASTFHAFCHALVAANRAPEDVGQPLRLLSATEQDVAIRELLRGTGVDDAAAGVSRWPRTIAGCLGTRGLAEEVRDVLARSRERDVDLRRLARSLAGGPVPDVEGAAVWGSLAAFADEYLDVLDARGVLDFAELVARAVGLAESPRVRADLRARYDAVFVDEYQDSDPAQVRLLQALAGDGRDLVVFGDPDQSIYAFRGADVRGILDFADAFRQRSGEPARTLVLRSSRRSVPALLAASREVAVRLPLAGLTPDLARTHRQLQAEAGAEPGSAAPLQVLTFPTAGAELDHVAEALRRAHLEDGLAWSDMAVLVRSGTRSIPAVRRVLGAAGVPLAVAGDEIPLRAEPAVAVLLAALRVAEGLAAARGPDGAPRRPDILTADTARSLLLSPLAGIDPADLRRLGRVLRAEARAGVSGDPGSVVVAAGDAGGPAVDVDEPAAERAAVGPDAEDAEDPEDAARGGCSAQWRPRPPEIAPSGELLAEALADPGQFAGADAPAAGPARRLAQMLGAAADAIARGAGPEEALWALWDGSPWPARLAAAATGSGAAARRADRDLDAVCALFDAAARAEEKAGHRGVANFLAEVAAQEIPGERPASADRAGEAVRLMTAHRSKGLEWSFVAVVGVQEGLWPDLRRRGSLLQADRLAPGGLTDPPPLSAVLAEERRLFYVAVTRARRRLLVTAVATADEDGDRPSRFLRELGVEPVAVRQRPARPLSVAGLVGELRSVLADPASSDALRSAAARRLAVLAAAADGDGRALVPAADPARWWGMAEPSVAPAPVRDPGRPLDLSGSSVDGIATCPLQWFLRHEVRADTAATVAMGYGNVIHALAEEVAAGAPADLDALMGRLDTVWSELAFDAGWQSAVLRDDARDALRRFLTWHAGRPGRSLLAAEVPFDVVVEVPAGGDLGGVDPGGAVPGGADPEGADSGGADSGGADPGGGAAGGAGRTDQVRLRGRFDRVEADADGRAVVVDFKTSKSDVSRERLEGHAQLGTYQVAVAAGALAGLPGAPADPGGAELVMLRQDGGRSGLPKVKAQPPPAEAADPAWAQRLLAQAARRIRTELFGPVPSEGCDRCAYRRCCSGRPEGRQVVE